MTTVNTANLHSMAESLLSTSRGKYNIFFRNHAYDAITTANHLAGMPRKDFLLTNKEEGSCGVSRQIDQATVLP